MIRSAQMLNLPPPPPHTLAPWLIFIFSQLSNCCNMWLYGHMMEYLLNLLNTTACGLSLLILNNTLVCFHLFAFWIYKPYVLKGSRRWCHYGENINYYYYYLFHYVLLAVCSSEKFTGSTHSLILMLSLSHRHSLLPSFLLSLFHWHMKWSEVFYSSNKANNFFFLSHT